MPSPDDASPAPGEHPPPAMQKKRGRGDGAEEDGGVPDVRATLPVCNHARDAHTRRTCQCTCEGMRRTPPY